MPYEYIQIHPQNPQSRLIQQAVAQIRKGTVFAYPTDSSYALGCHLGDKKALERIRRLRQLDDKHNFTLVCQDLSAIATYAKIDKNEYRILKAHTPGAYTFILNATREVPRRILHEKRRSIGIRIPDNAIVQALLAELNEPILSVTLQLPGEHDAISLIDDLPDAFQNQLDLIIDGGECGRQSTSVIDLTTETITVVRDGQGDVSHLVDNL